MLVSVVIAVYNRKNFITKCLESVLNQKFSDFEVIVIDDGSTDGTKDILASYSSQITLHFHNYNKGVSQARNQGILLSQGQFIAMIDSDCIADPNWLQELIKPFEQDDDIMIVGGQVKDIMSSNYWQMVNNGFNTFVSHSNGYVQQVIGCNLAIRQKFAVQHLYDQCLRFAAGDDTELCWRCQELGFNVFYTHQAIVSHYHRNSFMQSLVQQFLYGYANSYMMLKFDYFPYIPSECATILVILGLLVVGFLGLSIAFVMILPFLLVFSLFTAYRSLVAKTRTAFQFTIAYPAHFILRLSFCFGCLFYFLSSQLFLSKEGKEHKQLHWSELIIRKLHLYFYVFWLKCLNPKMQITFQEALLVSNAVVKHKSCRFLIFGVGYDTPFWLQLNAKGETVFLENDHKWLNLMKQRYPNAKIHSVAYKTDLSHWKEYLKTPEQLLMKLPKEVSEKFWDVILVDGPCGQRDYFIKTYGKEPPGRMQSIYMASKLIATGGDVFVHDCQRQCEEVYAAKFLSQRNYINQAVGRTFFRGNTILRHYRLIKKEYTNVDTRKISVALISPFMPVPPTKGGGIEQGIVGYIPYFLNVNFLVFSHIYGIKHTTFIRGSNAKYVQFPINRVFYKLQIKWNYMVAQKYHFRSFDYFLIQNVLHFLKDPPDIIEVRNNFFYIPLLKKCFPTSRFVLKMHNEYFFALPRLFQHYVDIINIVDCIIVVSQFLKDRITAHYPDAEKKIRVIHNGVNLSRFQKLQPDNLHLLAWRKKLNLVNEFGKTFIFVGRIAPMKGVHILIGAFKEVLKQHPDARLLIVGSSWFADTQMTPYLKKVIDMAQPLKDSIIFTGFVDHEELNYLYNLADICVVPSVWQEPFGLVNLEAMAAGCVVIASRVGGIPEILKDGQTGLLVEPANETDLRDKMIFLLEHKEEMTNIACSGIAYAQTYCNWSIAAQKTEKIYEDLLHENTLSKIKQQ